MTTSNLAADVSYRTRKYLVGIRLNSSVTDQPSEPTKARQSVGFNYQRFRPNRWYTEWFTGWEKNGARTNYLGEDESATEAEGRIEIRYLRRNLTPESSFRFTTTIYPLLSDFSQYRGESDLSLRREVFEDLFLEFALGYSYISDAPTDAEKSDYTATTSIGYSF